MNLGLKQGSVSSLPCNGSLLDLSNYRKESEPPRRPSPGGRLIPASELGREWVRAPEDEDHRSRRRTASHAGPARSRPRRHPARHHRPRSQGAVLRHQPGPVVRRRRPALRDSRQPLLARDVRLRLHPRAVHVAAPGRTARSRPRHHQPRRPHDRTRRRAQHRGTARGRRHPHQDGRRSQRSAA